MVEYFIDNISIHCGSKLFLQVIGIPIGTNCSPVLADQFLYSYQSEVLGRLFRNGQRKLACSFNLSYRYIDDLISFDKERLKDYIKHIYACPQGNPEIRN